MHRPRCRCGLKFSEYGKRMIAATLTAAECNAMRDQMPPANMVIAPEMLVAQATTVWLVETKGANFDTLRSILTFENEVNTFDPC